MFDTNSPIWIYVYCTLSYIGSVSSTVLALEAGRHCDWRGLTEGFCFLGGEVWMSWGAGEDAWPLGVRTLLLFFDWDWLAGTSGCTLALVEVTICRNRCGVGSKKSSGPLSEDEYSNLILPWTWWDTSCSNKWLCLGVLLQCVALVRSECGRVLGTLYKPPWLEWFCLWLLLRFDSPLRCSLWASWSNIFVQPYSAHFTLPRTPPGRPLF